MLTLEGPDGPSSVELLIPECIELAEAVASAGLADSGIVGVADAGFLAPSSAAGLPLERILIERFPAGSPVGRWAAVVAARASLDMAPASGATLPGGARDNASRDAAVLGLLGASLGVSANRTVFTATAAGRLLLRVVGLAVEAGRQRTGFARAVVEARIESMKQLAYGAGHEINNPLANIATRAQSLLPGERDPERRRRLAAIIDQAFRARDMIGALMLFARPPKPVRREATAQSIVAKAVAAVEAVALARGVQIQVEVAESRFVGEWDHTQLEEAVRAVLVNAIEASRGGGTVRVAVAADPGDPAACCVRVVDNGTGMDPETLAKAFDPFFSGREAGRGIGLGLSKVWRLVEINGGRTTIESHYGVGTTVSIQVPMRVDGGPATARKGDASLPV